MVNNSTNIIKTNLSSQLSEHNKKTTTYDNGNPGSGLGQAQICGRVKLVNGLPIISCTQWKKPLLANSPKARREQIWRVRLCKNSTIWQPNIVRRVPIILHSHLSTNLTSSFSVNDSVKCLIRQQKMWRNPSKSLIGLAVHCQS